jgi:hypothetical protein
VRSRCGWSRAEALAEQRRLVVGQAELLGGVRRRALVADLQDLVLDGVGRRFELGGGVGDPDAVGADDQGLALLALDEALRLEHGDRPLGGVGGGVVQDLQALERREGAGDVPGEDLRTQVGGDLRGLGTVVDALHVSQAPPSFIRSLPCAPQRHSSSTTPVCGVHGRDAANSRLSLSAYWEVSNLRCASAVGS